MGWDYTCFIRCWYDNSKLTRSDLFSVFFHRYYDIEWMKENGIQLPKLLNGALGTTYIGLFLGHNEFSATIIKLEKVTACNEERTEQKK